MRVDQRGQDGTGWATIKYGCFEDGQNAAKGMDGVVELVQDKGPVSLRFVHLTRKKVSTECMCLYM